MQPNGTTAPSFTISRDPLSRDFRLDWADKTPSTWHLSYFAAEQAARAQREHTRRAEENLSVRERFNRGGWLHAAQGPEVGR